MKATRLFIGHDSFGRGVEVAQSVNGRWFNRYQTKTHYGLTWIAWFETDQPEFETEGRYEHTGEKFTYTKPQLFWGFNKMDELAGPHRVRLPNKG